MYDVILVFKINEIVQKLCVFLYNLYGGSIFIHIPAGVDLQNPDLSYEIPAMGVRFM